MRRTVRPVTSWAASVGLWRRQSSHTPATHEAAPHEPVTAADAGSPSASPRAGGARPVLEDEEKDTPYRTLYPRVRMRAKTQERPYKRRTFTTFQDEEGAEGQAAGTVQLAGGHAEEQRQLSASSADVPQTAPATAEQHSTLAASPTQETSVALPEGNEVQQFLDEVQRQVDAAHFQRNQTIPFPEKPESNSPVFRRVRRHAKMTVEVADPDYPTFARKDQAVQLPPAQEHPWVRKNTPIGPYIVHGDGQINQLGGTGQVDFDDTSVNERLPTSYRGLQHRSILQQPLPQDNGRVVQDALVKHSFTLTGRGLFATRRIAKGENIMVVQSTARNVGVKGELERLEEMCTDILIACRDGDDRAREFLHHWILTGQPSSLLEHWPMPCTRRVVAAIGGEEVLDALELHPIHIARIAAILDLNSFLVESSFAERKGMAYFPEAGFLNHSCVPNADYDVMPEHVFRDSDYYLDEATSAAEVEAGESSSSKGDAEASRSGEVAAVPSKERNAAYFGDETRLTTYPGLTAADAPNYLFCCRAAKDIEPGEEILISYVPSQWSFDNRQYVLHDRYRFWCKCPKCAPVLDKKYSRVPKMLVGFVIFSVLLQMLVFHQREQRNAVEDDFAQLAALSEEERLAELRRRGIQPDDVSVDGMKRRRKKRDGLFERMEEQRLRDLYTPDNRGYLNQLSLMDPLAEPPR